MDSDPQTSLIPGAPVIHVVNVCVPIMPKHFPVPVGERCCVPPIRPSPFDACVKYRAFQLPCRHISLPTNAKCGYASVK